jgi:hypothetical protein
MVEPALLRFIAQQNLDEDERPETEEQDGGDVELQQTGLQPLLSGPVASRLFPRSLHQVLQKLKVRVRRVWLAWPLNVTC